MITGASVSAQPAFRSLTATSGREEGGGRSGINNPHTDGVAPADNGPSSPSIRVQPASEAQASGNQAAGQKGTNSETLPVPEKPDNPAAGKKASGEPLNEAEQRQVDELKEIDAKVRAHEQAHAAAGGPHASAPSYEFTTGPDGKRYATSGEVQIDTSPEKNPEATIRKMDIVIRAALAPADSSAQDKQVARQAQQQRAQAQVELSKQREAERNEASGKTDENATGKAEPAAGEGENKPVPDSRLNEAIAAYEQASGSDDAAQVLQIILSVAA